MTMTKKPSLVAVVPFRSVSGGKERLVTVLSDAERSELSARLLERTLRALLGASSVDSVLLVSPDPLARALGRSLGATAIDDGGAELNRAIRIGLDAAEQLGAKVALIVPVDLATITATAIDALLTGWRQRSAVRATQPIGLLAADDGGTAALILPIPTRLPLRYGAASAESHRAAALSLDLKTMNDALTLGYSKLTNNIIADVFDYYSPQPAPVHEDRKSTRLNSSHVALSRMPSSA